MRFWTKSCYKLVFDYKLQHFTISEVLDLLHSTGKNYIWFVFKICCPGPLLFKVLFYRIFERADYIELFPWNKFFCLGVEACIIGYVRKRYLLYRQLQAFWSWSLKPHGKDLAGGTITYIIYIAALGLASTEQSISGTRWLTYMRL